MNVTRDVIVDLLPVYLAGEASGDSKPLIEEHLAGDAELAERLRKRTVENLTAILPAALPPELELRTLKRTRSVLNLQR